MIDVIIGSTELFLARSWTVLERVDVISACCRIIPVIGLSCVGGAVETEASSTGVSMCPVGTGGSSRGMIWPSGWLSSSNSVAASIAQKCMNFEQDDRPTAYAIWKELEKFEQAVTAWNIFC